MNLLKITYLNLLLSLLPFLVKSQSSVPGEGELEFYPMPFVNTTDYEYAQGLIGENMLIVRPAYEGTLRDKMTDALYFDLFQWDPQAQRLSMLPFTVNTPAHEGSACWSEADQELIFSRNSSTEKNSAADRSGLFIWKNGADTVEAFPHNHLGTVLCHPTVSSDGKLLIFAADLPEGYGGMDLYYSVKKRNGWSAPINLGPAINTPGNEVFPFLHRSNTLFYSSTGYEGLGGLDIFYSTPLAGVWQRPRHLPAPFNSTGDDFSLWLNPLGTQGWLNSNREGSTGKDDIFRFSAAEPLFLPEGDHHDIEVLDRETMSPVPGAVLSLQFNQAWNKPFKKRKNAAPEAPKPSQQSHFVTDSAGMAGIGLTEDLWLQVFVKHPDYRNTTEIIHFDTEHLWHQILLEKNCHLLHGTVLRKESVEGIADVSIDLLNSRGAVIDSTRSGENGSFSFCLRADSIYSLHFSHEKYISTTAPAWAMNAYDTHKKWQLEMAPASDTPELLPEGPLEKGSIFVFDRIYYDYNDSEIRADATAELDALFAKMQENPGMRIEMIAHTDSRGQADYNLRLSVERAEAARRYLLKKGIDKNRIRAVGYGENQLRNHCRNGVECSEEEHAFNRRTEIRILAIE